MVVQEAVKVLRANGGKNDRVRVFSTLLLILRLKRQQRLKAVGAKPEDRAVETIKNVALR